MTIAQTASPFPFVSVAVSPTARLIGAPGSSIAVSIGSGDTTVATYTNYPPGSGGSSVVADVRWWRIVRRRLGQRRRDHQRLDGRRCGQRHDAR